MSSWVTDMYLSQFRDPRTGAVDWDEVRRFEREEKKRMADQVIEDEAIRHNQLDDENVRRREALVRAFTYYEELLKEMGDHGSQAQKENALASRIQLHAARRVLWMDR